MPVSCPLLLPALAACACCLLPPTATHHHPPPPCARYTYGGCRHNAYTCICACGPNAATLHYGHAGAPNARRLLDGDMGLLDMGAEYHCYCSDITCSYPINSKFTEDQKLIYNGVLMAQKVLAGCACARLLDCATARSKQSGGTRCTARPLAAPPVCGCRCCWFLGRPRLAPDGEATGQTLCAANRLKDRLADWRYGGRLAG